MNLIISWGKRPFQLVIWGSGLFLVLTLVAMLVYPGGSKFNPDSTSYNFFHNFFSELGFPITRGGASNLIGAALFFIALTMAGLGLVLFFLINPQFFWTKWYLKLLSLLGTMFGVISGLAYVGIAFTPANLLPGPHLQFVLLAFRAFLPAVIFYFFAILLNPDYANRYAGLYLIFTCLLTAYIVLITRGPNLDTAEGVMIQVIGQKMIVYAAILTIMIQSWGASKMFGDTGKGAKGN